TLRSFTFHFTISDETKNDVYALPFASNSVCSGPRPGFCTSPCNAASYLITGMPSYSPSKFFAAMACCILVNENTGITAANFPLPTMYSPEGSVSQPRGDLG